MSEKLFLSEIYLENFKNLKINDDTLLQLNHLNILIGPNGSGKSNFIRVFKFLKDSLISYLEDTQGVTEFEKAANEFGDGKISDTSVAHPATVTFGFRFSPSQITETSLQLLFMLMLKGNNTSPVIKKEVLSDIGRQFIYYNVHESETGTGVVSIYEDESHTSSRHNKLQNVPVNRLALNCIPELLEISNYPPENTPVFMARRQLIETIAGWRLYNANDMNLYNIRHSEPKIGPADLYLSRSGENLPLVLHNLIQKDIDFEERINDAMKKILPLTRKIKSAHSGRLRVTTEWYMEGMKERFYLNDISDGSVRMLCWAVILHSPELPSLLVIDEPETGLHPSWMRTLAEWIKMASEKTQVIIATHSPDLLDHFTDRYNDVICFEYDGKAHFMPKRLHEAELNAKLADGWELGDLYRVGDSAVG